ncbi:MAG: aminotransferase class I/II-fold pyridoxal phosphate-dependent enzyme, partial [Anaerolineales bacterium]|nr:aminotransferase class I/II-fold pyridoxal phosphate-dependent enzyme [Anaerolineales bacterium]
MNKIDLRSDTVTLPTPAMRAAMANAEVGDDVMGEDPTVNRLEEIAAARLKKDAALFVASGTMANLVALLTHCARGDEVIVGDKAHSFINEVGGMAALGGIIPRTIPNQSDGTLALGDITNAIRGDNVHWPPTKLIALENTHNACNGSPLTPAYHKAVYDLARARNLRVHT